MKYLPLALAAISVCLAASCTSDGEDAPPDVVFVHGKIFTVDTHDTIASALAIRGGRIVAVSNSDDDMARRAGAQTRVVDLQGRTVIPGLIDSHIHAIRDGLTFGNRPDWSEASTLAEALDTVRAAVNRTPPGTWVAVIGGWDPNQFVEKRAPTPAELDAISTDHPIYVQQLYDLAILNHCALQTWQITAQTPIPPAGKVDVDENGNPTGVIEAFGSVATLAALAHRIPEPSFADQVAGIRAYFQALNRTGVTGIVDEGGSDFLPEQYQPLFSIWRQHEMTVRVRYELTAPHPGTELSDIQNLVQLLPPHWGDDWLRFMGPGEIAIWGMHDGSATAPPFTPAPGAQDALLQFALWAAAGSYTLHIHASQNADAERILDVFEKVNSEIPITGLRWVITHIEDATDQTLQRMKALGLGYTIQDRLYFAGDDYIKIRPPAVVERAPPIVTAMHAGLVVGGGTDALAISSYNPFVSLRWILDGKTIAGTPTRAQSELPSRADALRIYTQNSAWVTFDEAERGSLEVGKFADLAVLSEDYLTVPAVQIGKIESVLTMVEGKAVYAAGPFADWAPRQQ